MTPHHISRILATQSAVAEYSTNRLSRAGAEKLMREAGLDVGAIAQLLDKVILPERKEDE